jgi:hypothetical protein
MDVAIKRIAEKYAEIQRQIRVLTREAESIKQTMALIGYRPEYLSEVFADSDPSQDEQYAEKLPFKHTTLVKACKQILVDHKFQWLTKNQVEYLASMGGYEFSTDNPKNSVDVTLRRLASHGFCEVENNLQGNKYRWPNKPDEKEVETQ